MEPTPIRIRQLFCLVLGSSLLASAFAIPASASQPSMANVCDLGVDSANPPDNSLDAVRGLITRRVACQQTLELSLETGLQTLQTDFDVLRESISAAAEALSTVKVDTEALQRLALSGEATIEMLDGSLQAVAASVIVLEAALDSVGDDAQLANLVLQNALQRLQQTLQLISNISKMLHDTAAAIIKNLKG